MTKKRKKRVAKRPLVVVLHLKQEARKKMRNEPRELQTTRQVVNENHELVDTGWRQARSFIVQRRYEAVLSQIRNSEDARLGECTQVPRTLSKPSKDCHRRCRSLFSL